MMRTADRGLALLYFEAKAVRPNIAGLAPNARYRWTWFDPRSGQWGSEVVLTADATGAASAPPFPGGDRGAAQDWAAKLVLAR